MSVIITNEMKEMIEEAGYKGIDEQCTVPVGSDAYGAVYSDLSEFLEILDESETFEEVQKTLDHVRPLQYCGFHAAYDEFYSLMVENCPVYKADRDYYS